MNLYLAVDSETGDVKAFTGFEDLRDFSKAEEYGYDYYSIPVEEEFADVHLFLNTEEEE